MNKKESEKGFTLLEMLVAMSVFIIVATIATGVFTFSLRSHLRVIQNQAATEDLRFALEKMARAIRVSTVTSSDGSASDLQIQHPLLGDITYNHSVATGAILENGSPLTGEKVRVTKLLFVVDGKTDPNRQTRITIVMDAESPIARPEAETQLKLSTTISPRFLQP